MKRRRRSRARVVRGRAFSLPVGQRTFTIKVSGGEHAGEYSGAATVAATARKAREEFLPHLGPHETLRVVHFDRDGRYTFTDKVIKE
jgi:hypothetical protein